MKLPRFIRKPKEDVVEVMWPNFFFVCSSCGKHINGYGSVNDPNRFKCCANPKFDSKYIKEVMTKIPRYVVENATFITISR